MVTIVTTVIIVKKEGNNGNNSNNGNISNSSHSSRVMVEGLGLQESHGIWVAEYIREGKGRIACIQSWIMLEEESRKGLVYRHPLPPRHNQGQAKSKNPNP